MNIEKTKKTDFLLQNNQFFNKRVETFRRNVRVDNTLILIC